MTRLASLRSTRSGAAVWSAVLSLVLLAVAGAIGLALHQPWLFPSLGPTVMLYFESPDQPASRPVNALVGHGVGLVAGTAMLLALGLQHAPPATAVGLTPAYLLAGASSVALTTLVLTWLRMPHPPAGATTLIVSLGILSTPLDIGVMAGAIVLVTVLDWGWNRLSGLRPAPRDHGI